MLAWWATGSNLDARLADMGLERQLLDPGDPAAFPPVPAVYESDEDARLRYYLAPHAPAAGSRMQYRREVFTLGERPTVKVDSTDAGVVTVTYTFDPDGYAARVKDGNGRRTAPGEVQVTVLAGRRRHAVRGPARRRAPTLCPTGREAGNGSGDGAGGADQTLQDPRGGQDQPGPRFRLTQVATQRQLQAYADSCHRLEGRVDPSWIDYTLHTAGAVQLEILEPLQPIVTTAFQAPYCTGLKWRCASYE